MFLEDVLIRNYFERNGNFASITNEDWFGLSDTKDVQQKQSKNLSIQDKCYAALGYPSTKELSSFDVYKLRSSLAKNDTKELEKYEAILGCDLKEYLTTNRIPTNSLFPKFKKLFENLNNILESSDEMKIFDLLVAYFTTSKDVFINYDNRILSVSDFIRVMAISSEYQSKDRDKFIKQYCNDAMGLLNKIDFVNDGTKKYSIENNTLYCDIDLTIRWDVLISTSLWYIFNVFNNVRKYRKMLPSLVLAWTNDKIFYLDILEVCECYYGSYNEFLKIFSLTVPDESLAYEHYGIVLYNFLEVIYIANEESKNFTEIKDLSYLLNFIPKNKINNLKHLSGGQ